VPCTDHHRQTSRRAGAGRPVSRQYHNSYSLKEFTTWRHGQHTRTKTFWPHCFNLAINNRGMEAAKRHGNKQPLLELAQMASYRKQPAITDGSAIYTMNI